MDVVAIARQFPLLVFSTNLLKMPKLAKLLLVGATLALPLLALVALALEQPPLPPAHLARQHRRAAADAFARQLLPLAHLELVEAQRGNGIEEDEEGLPPPVDGSMGSSDSSSSDSASA